MPGANILGVGMTLFGRHAGQSHSELARAAVTAALADAGLQGGDLGMAIYANVIQGFFAQEMSIPGEYALRPLGIQGVRVMHVEAACASSTIGLHVAVDYVRAGLADAVLVVGVEKLYSSDRAKRFAVFQQPRDAQEAQAYLEHTRGMLAPAPEGAEGPGPNIMMDAYAAQARLHMATYGTTARQIAARGCKEPRALRAQSACPVPQRDEHRRGIGGAARGLAADRADVRTDQRRRRRRDHLLG